MCFVKEKVVNNIKCCGHQKRGKRLRTDLSVSDVEGPGGLSRSFSVSDESKRQIEVE